MNPGGSSFVSHLHHSYHECADSPTPFCVSSVPFSCPCAQVAAAEAAAADLAKRKQALQKKKGKTKSDKEKAAEARAAAEAAEAERRKAEDEARRVREEEEKKRRLEQLERMRKEVRGGAGVVYALEGVAGGYEHVGATLGSAKPMHLRVASTPILLPCSCQRHVGAVGWMLWFECTRSVMQKCAQTVQTPSHLTARPPPCPIHTHHSIAGGRANGEAPSGVDG
jgi:hypothetical protein